MDPLLPDIAPADDPYSFSELPEDDLNASWIALRTHSLHWHPGADLEDLLRRWPLTGEGDPETAAVVTVPSRAVEAADVLSRRGFAPMVVVAARLPGRGRAGRSAVGIRPLAAEDLDVAVELHLETMRFDSLFGMVTARPSSAARLREHIASLLERPEPCGWLAERGGEAVGFLYCDLPGHSDWIASWTSVRPVAYIGLLGVRADSRGQGVGAALVDHAHSVLDEAGVGVTLLHHALPNPLSTPFWYSHGYRPLWTTWQRRPAR
ncbi:ribosomal protein S18 acetylase RimI-like enzyme [Saccharothrix saharensis]|uniref:Ribosomal protein S18 acetylase RimI-like enzyme n=1 Tax=Saccharothrix saharensis TaxID=571190 RepID=A0A543JHZ0_9PSEU|nr:GNAT family N-acetyltransferase [Saccharothrix saharensis]TQM82452.1 ribosomal protein S18 acetylase RimI-like enzyme [Saccharothrix saharensis]